MTSSATLLSFGSRTNTSTTTPTDFSHDSHLVTSGYSGASYDSTTGLINIPVTAGQATIGFGSYVPQNYTGPGAMYLYAVIIKDSNGNVLVNEEFNTWTGTLPTTTGEKTAQFTGDAGRTWNVYTNANSIYTGYGAAFASKTTNSDKGVVYPADGGGPFKVLMSTDLNIAAGVTGVTVDLRWGYQISNSGTEARTFSIGFQNQAVSAKDLFSFLGPAPVDTTPPTLAITSDLAKLKVGETATVTFTFSEDPGATFTASDIAVNGGTLGALTGTGMVRTAVFTPAAGTEASASISVAAGTYADAAGNNNVVASALSIPVDTKPPTLAISSDLSALKAGDTATVTFTFSEDPGIGFGSGIVSVAGGTLGQMSGSGTVRTAVFTPSANSETTASIAVAGADYADAAGNTGSASSLSLTVDTKAPTLAITSDAAALKAGQSATVTFTFSDDPGAGFNANAISVAGGTLGALSGTGLVRTAVFTPSANAETTASIAVAGTSYADAAGNSGSASSLSIAVDTKAPTLAIGSDLSALKAGQAATVSFTFSENPGASFTSSDIAVTGGTLGALSGTGLVRTAVFTPAANLEGSASIAVTAGSYADAAGNTGSASSLSLAIDTEPPTLAITSDMVALKAGQAATVTFTFSENPGASFTQGSVAVSGGTLGALSGSGLVRTAVFTPNANMEGNASIAVAGANYADAAGNTGSASSVSIAVDTKAPTLAITSDAAALKAGQAATVTFTFSEDPGATFTAGGIAISGGTLGALTGTGLVRTAVFTPSANTETTATISVAGANYADAAGNAGSASQLAIAVDTKPPTLAISSDLSAVKAGQAATVTFTFSENPGATFTSGDIVVSGGTLGTLSGTGLVRTAVFTPTANLEGSANISVAGANYADAAGNTGASAQLSIAVDTKPPALAISSDMAALKAGQAATVTFTFSEDPGASFTANSIAVSGGTLGALLGTGLVRTAVFTPSINTETTANIAVAGANYADAAGNTGSASQLSIAVDTKPPVLAITSDTAALKAGQATTVTFAFSEDPGASFTSDGIAVAGGTLGALSGTGLVRTAVFTPSANTETTASIAVANYADAAGNTGSAASLSIAVDTKPPSLAISSDLAALKAGQAATITFTFSEDPGASFSASGIAVSGGTLGALSGTGLVRTAVFTPSANTETTANIAVAGANYKDAAGNTGSASQLAIAVDTKPPVLGISSDMAALKAGQAATVTFTFSEDPGASFSADGVAVSGGTLGALSGTGLVRTAVFTPSINTETTAHIAVAGANYADAAGNTGAAASLAIAVDTKPPVLAITSSMADLVAAETATITFSFSEDPGASFTLADIAVSGGTVASLAGSGLTRTVVFTPAAHSAGTASVSVAAGAYSDAAGNDGAAAALAPLPFSTTAPAITFGSLALSQDTGTPHDFVTGVSEQTVRATLSTALLRGQKVLGSLDGGAHWIDITSKVSGTTLAWTGVTLPDNGTLKLEVVDGAGQTGPVASQAYLVDHLAPTDILLSSNWVLDSAGRNSVVGTLTALDPTPHDVVDITLVSSGDGRSADNGAFAIVGGQLVALDPAHLGAGTKHIFVSATDIVGHSISREMTVQVVHGTVQPGPGDDGDNIANIVEQQVPVQRSANGQYVAGDGNGDGIADSAQSNVTSAPFLKSSTAQSNPGTSAQTYVSLVADSLAGKADAAGHAVLQSVTQLDAPFIRPADLKMPLGQISFQASVQAGATEHFSLFVDNGLAINGYWKQAANGDWVNLASAKFGGSMTMDGGKIRLDFSITDGGQFDADGKADGVITDPGAAGYRPGMLDSDLDGFPDALEAANGLTVGTRDNDVFGSSKLFVMQLYRDILYREADGAGLGFWQAQIDSGKLSKAQVAASFLESQEVTDGTAAVARLFVGGLGHMPEMDVLHNFVDVLHAGSTITALAGNIAAGTEFQAKYGALGNAAFTSQLFQDVLHRGAGQAELAQWTAALDKGASRGDLLANLAGSAENVAATSHLISVALGYYDMLVRAPEQAGQDYWINVLDHGTSVASLVGSFIASPEYHGRFLP
ncbi:hypothetical protein GCM10027321_21090 [Massilia terrae]|uniref:Ig-like domain-containing protein n=1 Tax=Massilia terrae TaxID=1811224 RepID=A0ABT2CV74_9BURK|nr:Ig-like domain-containing protein [Massilia terrae]MCS0657884.1 Ig-like domain-containing protein [Massilia terrae]